MSAPTAASAFRWRTSASRSSARDRRPAFRRYPPRPRSERLRPRLIGGSTAPLLGRGARLSPDGREPRLFVSRPPRRTIIVFDQGEPCGADERAPFIDRVKRPIALAIEPFGVFPARIRGEQDPARAKRAPELAEDARQLLGRDMKERRVGED